VRHAWRGAGRQDDDLQERCVFHLVLLSPVSRRGHIPAGPKFLKGLGTKCEAGTVQPQCEVKMNLDGSATLSLPAGAKSSSCSVQ
jgi:hypothetical protein